MSTTDLADVARWETRKYLSLKNTLMQSVDTAYKVGLLQQQGSPKFSFALQECQHLVDVQAEDNLRQQPGTVYETFHILHQLLIGKLITQIHKNPSTPASDIHLLSAGALEPFATHNTSEMAPVPNVAGIRKFSCDGSSEAKVPVSMQLMNREWAQVLASNNHLGSIKKSDKYREAERERETTVHLCDMFLPLSSQSPGIENGQLSRKLGKAAGTMPSTPRHKLPPAAPKRKC
jgi:hypothetical protein